MRIYISLLFSFGIIFFLSCEERNHSRKKNLEASDFWVNLPDSILIDSPIIGFVKYKLSDSPLADKKVHKKYTFLYATVSKKKITSFDELKMVPHDTFASIEKNIIPIYNMKSQDKGNVFFSGFLIEQFFYKKNEDSIRIISKERRFEKSIKVY